MIRPSGHFDLVSSPVWWEAETNIHFPHPLHWHIQYNNNIFFSLQHFSVFCFFFKAIPLHQTLLPFCSFFASILQIYPQFFLLFLPLKSLLLPSCQCFLLHRFNSLSLTWCIFLPIQPVAQLKLTNVLVSFL